MRDLRRLLPLASIALLGGCAAGNGGHSGGGTGGAGDTGGSTSSTSTTTTSAGGSGGSTTTTTSSGGSGGSTSSSGGTGGSGGSTTSTSAGGGTSTSTTGGGGAGGMAPTETALLFANSAAAVLGAAQHPGGSWDVATPGAGATHWPASALLDVDRGLGLYRAPADGTLTFVSWSGGSFAAPLAIGGLNKSMDAPAMIAWNGGAAAVYHKADFKHYFALYQPASGWSPVAEPILANNLQSFGPSPPSIAVVKGDVVIAYAGDDNNLYDQTRSAGVWQASNGHGVGGTVNLTPAIVEVPSGASDAMIAYVRKSDAQIMFTVRSAANGAWSAVAAVPSALSNDPVALASTGGGGAALAFRGTNTMIYTCFYVPGNNPPWTAPQSFGVSTPAPPALARGIGGHDVEMAFVASGQANHASYQNGVWSAADVVGGVDVTGISLATFAQ